MKFDRSHAFRYAMEERVGPDLIRITARNPSPLTFHGTGTYVLGRSRAAVVDPGPDLDEHLGVLLRTLDAGNPTHVLITHRHQDHAGLASRLADARGLAVYAHDDAPVHSHARLAGETREEGLSAVTLLEDGDMVEGEEFRLEAIHTPGHTGDHVCFVDHDNRRVFCGDHIMAWSTTVILPPDGHVGRYLQSLERLKAFEQYVFWPTHGPPIRRPREWIDALIEHRAERERQLLEALDDAEASADQLVETIYGELDPRLARAAKQSLLAGIAWLEERGGISRRADDATGETLYALS